MSGHSGGVSTAQPYTVDQSKLATFMGTAEGQQFAKYYNPTSVYAQVGDSVQAVNPSSIPKGGNVTDVGNSTHPGEDVTQMIDAFNAWVGSNTQTQTNWDAYKTLADANEGGEGDNTITSGAAANSRAQLLGALANAGNPTAGASTSPTGGLGSLGMLVKNGRPVQGVGGTK